MLRAEMMQEQDVAMFEMAHQEVASWQLFIQSHLAEHFTPQTLEFSLTVELLNALRACAMLSRAAVSPTVAVMN